MNRTKQVQGRVNLDTPTETEKGFGEIVLWLRALVALVEDQGLTPRTYVVAHHHPWLHLQVIKRPLLVSGGIRHAHGIIHLYTYDKISTSKRLKVLKPLINV